MLSISPTTAVCATPFAPRGKRSVGVVAQLAGESVYSGLSFSEEVCLLFCFF
jgi:hypothetical protein